ncbi:MAG: N-acetylmuramoyl-L-alanine amidase [Rhizobiaceae bacterium]
MRQSGSRLADGRSDPARAPGRGVHVYVIVWLIAAMALACLTTSPAAAQQNQGGSVNSVADTADASPLTVHGGSIAIAGESTRLTLEFDRKSDFKSFFMNNPPRLVVDGPSMLFRFSDATALEPKGLVSFLRYGAIARDRSRLVASLSGPARIGALAVEPLGVGGKYRLVIDLVPATGEAFVAMVEEQQKLVGKSGEVVTVGDRVRPAPRKEGRKVVVIDPGHGGIDGGAKGSSGTFEKELTLELGKQIASEIEKLGIFDVRMTREEDLFVSLRERVAFARRNEADLVISIHADSLRQSWVRGATIYTLSRKASDDLAHELAESENAADLVAGLDNPQQDDFVTDILADLTLRETTVFSRSFSALLVSKLERQINLIKNPQRSAAFAVLKAPEIPSVLIELGYLSNPEDEKLMTDQAWQNGVASSLALTVKSYFDNRR